jgi:GNAT superfamily N-acetyltransferase
MTLPPEGLIPRLLALEIAYTALRAGIIARRPGNPFGADMRRFGPVFACRVRGVPSPWLNRAMALGEATAASIPAVAAWFAEAAITPRYEVTPDQAGPALARALAATGALPTDGDAMVWGVGQGGSLPEGITTVTTAPAMETFLDTHLAGLAIPARVNEAAKSNMRGWLGQPGLTLLLAHDGANAAGACVLYRGETLTYVADMSSHPAHRGRGIQTRLLAAAHAINGEGGIVWARCRFLSQSHRNLQRVGLRTLCTTSFWL